jgi:hypothetical protein
MLVAGNIVGWGGPYSISMALKKEEDLTLFQKKFNDSITQGSGEELMEMDPDELRVAIGRYLDLGPDILKYGGTSHFPVPTMIGFSPRAQRVLAEEAHARGLPVDVHSTTSGGLRLSVLAGIDVIQHPEVTTGVMPDELVELIVDRGVVCVLLANWTTGEVYEGFERRIAARDEAEGQEEEAEFWRERTSAELRCERRLEGEGFLNRLANTEKLIDAGCIITIGTDTWLGDAPEFRSRTIRTRESVASLPSKVWSSWV